MAIYKILGCPYNVPKCTIDSMLVGDKVTSVVSNQVVRYLGYLQSKQVDLNALICINNQKHAQAKSGFGLSLFKAGSEEEYKRSYNINRELLYKLQFLMGLLKFFFEGMSSDEIEDAQCYIKDLSEMLASDDALRIRFIENPVDEKGYSFDNIDFKKLGLEGWFGKEVPRFEEKPACTLL